MDKLKIGIFFGGSSREREVSFAGGRTVFDNLNKSIFSPIPIFVDSFNNFILLDWQYIYKGSIRDFYPPVAFLPEENKAFQYYQENLEMQAPTDYGRMAAEVGKLIAPPNLKDYFDIAFLCLHGEYGEDGRLQGLLEFLNIPYTGSGILSSSIGINKKIQKEFMSAAGFNLPKGIAFSRSDLDQNPQILFERVKKDIGFPAVVKPAHQGSSIGVSILMEEDKAQFSQALQKSFFRMEVRRAEWKKWSTLEKEEHVRSWSDIREGIGMPCTLAGEEVCDPNHLIQKLNALFVENSSIVLEAINGEETVLIEKFIRGREFSCIVIEDEQGEVIALPPTEIKKGQELFDYRSKYLPGLSRKVTPIDLPESEIEKICSECERLFKVLKFDVYARIDGFITKEGEIFLNDPNTTSGMMPSSFFFHQAAEIGLNPSQFLTYIIHTSLLKRRMDNPSANTKLLFLSLERMIREDRIAQGEKMKVAVIFGGYSSERHISVESGRNVYEKLASSGKYLPIPIFLSGSAEEHQLYQVPVNLLLKDNADDIRDKAKHFQVHPSVKKIIDKCKRVTEKFSSSNALASPKTVTYSQLAEQCRSVFIALHGRPGEDGCVQEQLEKYGLPYNGSGKASSQITINKFETNEILKSNGILVAPHLLLTKEKWLANPAASLKEIEAMMLYPFIAKPVDDGCSSAVKMIKSAEDFYAFARLIYRNANEDRSTSDVEILHLKGNEEFPMKDAILVEELIRKKDAIHFLEITGGILSHYDHGAHRMEAFEASEALSGGDVLSLEEKFLAGQGQNITPARYATDPDERKRISEVVKSELLKVAAILKIEGYCRIDAFVRVYSDKKVEVVIIEINSLPGMTPATCIFHQAAISGYKPFDFIDQIIAFGIKRSKALKNSELL